MYAYIWTGAFFCAIIGCVRSASSSPYTSSNKSKQVLQKLESTKQGAIGDKETSLDAEQKRGWKDNTMQVWGKRSLDSNQVSASEIDNLLSNHEAELASNNERFIHKRKWGQNSMQVWGKRNSGIRNANDELIAKLADSSKEIEDKKRKWGENSMAVWGKRYSLSGSKNFEEEKRKWGQNNMAVWGKRLQPASSLYVENDKRKWGDNSMAVWGKRLEISSGDSSNDVLAGNKRKWSDNSMKVWGKRSNPTAEALPGHKSEGKDGLHPKINEEDVLSDASIEKRKWADNTMQVWGKRNDETSNTVDQHSIAKRSLDGGRMSDAELWQSLLARNHNRGLMREGPKRNWETNTMRVWGKRSWSAPVAAARSNFSPIYSPLLRRQWQQSDDAYAPSMSDYLADVENDATESDKRAWSSDNGMRVWG